MANVRFFGPARAAAGESTTTVDAATVAGALAELRARYDAAFGALLDGSKVWVDGEPAAPGRALGPDDELAVLPPVSGG